MSNLINQEFQREYDDELDLYEIIDVLVKRKKTILVTFIIVFLISLCSGIYIKDKKPDYVVRDILINQKEYNIDGVNQVLPENMYLLNRRINRFFEIPGVEEIYENRVNIKNRNMESKRKFLENIINVEDGKGRYIIKVKILKDGEISKAILDKYVYNLRRMDNLPERVESDRVRIQGNLTKLDIELAGIAQKMKDIFSSDKKLIKMKPEEQISYISYRYPGLFLRRKEITKYYDYYTDRLLELNKISNDDKIIRVISDSYIEEGKSKAKLIVGVGTVVALFLGVMMGFLKEFIDGYKKRYKK